MVTEHEPVALFVDVDNIVICAQNAGLPFNIGWIIERVRQEGPLMTSKAYADWSAIALGPFLRDFQRYAIELVQLGTTGPRIANEHKNTADIQLAVDALEMVMSPVRPRTVAIVSGDRDFVPLVQKLKRYGTRLIGIGVEGTVSPVLAQACDSFIFYDDLVPSAPEEAQTPVTIPEISTVFPLLRRVVEAMMRDGRNPSGSAVVSLMRQVDPTFDLSRFKTTFKDLALSAEKAGYVKLEEQTGSDFLVYLGETKTVTLDRPIVAPREYDFSTPSATLASYRTILQENRIPLLPWIQRKEILRYLWKSLEERGDSGLSLDEMRWRLSEFSGQEGFNASNQAIEKFLYSLNFARCFVLQGNTGELVQVPDQIHLPITPAFGEQDARRALDRNYVRVLVREGAQLDLPCVVDLLLDDSILADSDRLMIEMEIETICDELQPPTAFTIALRAARKNEISLAE